MQENQQNQFGSQNSQPVFPNQGYYPQNQGLPAYQPNQINPNLNPNLPVRPLSQYNPQGFNHQLNPQNFAQPIPKKNTLKIVLWSFLGVAFLFSVGSGSYYFYEKRGAFGPKVKPVSVQESDFSKFNKDTVKTSTLAFEDVTFAIQSQSGKFVTGSNKPAVDPSLYKTFTGEQFKNFYEKAVLTYQNLDTADLTTKPAIRQNPEADKKIQAIAEKRGYKLRPQAIESKLQFTDGQRLQQEAIQSWLLLKSTAAADGIQLELVSGYRSIVDQKQIFNDTLGATVTDEQIAAGTADSQIDEVLKTTSIPGYSRHHTGFTVDFGCGNKILTIFAQTPCYEWLSKFNYLNAKRFGFIPSYPQGAGNQGPDPEAWEYVWVGERNLRS